MNSERASLLTSIGLLILRLGIGANMMTHGWGKLQMVLGGQFHQFGDPIGLGSTLSLIMVTFAEFFCALFVMVGFATRFAAFPVVFAMGVAAFVAHGADPWTMSEGARLYMEGEAERWSSKQPALLYLIPFLALVFTGAGRFSIDHLIAPRCEPLIERFRNRDCMKKKYIQLAVGIAVSAVFLYLAFRNIDFGELFDAFRATSLFWAVMMMVVTMVGIYWRTFRWRIFLLPTKELSTWRLFTPLMVGFGFNNIFPARAGEFARPLALMKQDKVPYGTGFSTIILERLVDMLTLLVLLITMPLYISLDPDLSFAVPGFDNLIVNVGWIQGKMPAISVMAFVLLLVALSFVIPSVERMYIRILHAMPLIPDGIKHKLEGFIKSFASGFHSLKSPRAVVMTVIHSFIIWFFVAFSFQLMSWGFPGVTMHFGHALAFLIVTCIVIMIPSSPGFWGLYEFGGMFALVAMGIVPNTSQGQATALAFTMVVHFLQWFPITVYGLWCAGKLSISASDADAAAESMDRTESAPAGKESARQ